MEALIIKGVIRRYPGVFYFSAMGCILVCLGYLGLFVNVDLFLLASVALLMVWLIGCRTAVFLEYLFFHVSALWCILDVYLIENTGMLVPNLGVYGTHNGSLFWLVFSEYVFVGALCAFNTHRPETRHRKVFTKTTVRNGIATISITIICILLILSLIEAFFTGYYAGNYRNRFEYVNNAATFSLRYQHLFLMLLPVISMYATYKRKRWILLGYFSIYCVYQLLMGNKFGSLFIVVCILILCILYSDNQSQRNMQKVYKRCIIAIVGALSFFLFYSLFQMSLEHRSFVQGLEQLMNRLGNGQGDVWWGVYAQTIDNPPRTMELWDELGGLTAQDGGQLNYNFAVYKMMNYIAPESVLNEYASQGIRFTASTDASLLYYFGPLGLLIGKVLLALLASVIVRGLIRSISERTPVEALCYVGLLQHCTRIAGMSEFYLFLSKTFVLYVTVLLLLRFAREVKAHRHAIVLARAQDYRGTDNSCVSL